MIFEGKATVELPRLVCETRDNEGILQMDGIPHQLPPRDSDHTPLRSEDQETRFLPAD